MSVKVIVCKDSNGLAQRGAEEVVRIAHDILTERDRFTIALAGGSTPEKMYKLLVGYAYSSKIEWSKVQIYFGDERFVPLIDEERSNYAMAKRSLLSSSLIADDQVFAFDTSLPTVQASAVAYEQMLIEQLGSPPVFDLILLGMGNDGHTASLFPHGASLDVSKRFVVDTPPGVLPPPVDRMTATIPLLQQARNVVVLIGGEQKAQAVFDVLEGHASIQEHPIASLLQSEGSVIFLLDEAAAHMLAGTEVITQ